MLVAVVAAVVVAAVAAVAAAAAVVVVVAVAAEAEEQNQLVRLCNKTFQPELVREKTVLVVGRQELDRKLERLEK